MDRIGASETAFARSQSSALEGSGRQERLAATGRQRRGIGSGREPRPEDIIPLGEEGMGDF